jgi:hypothetical protein
MNKNNMIGDKYMVHGNSKYDPDFHPSDCERMGLEGLFQVEMALEWKVSVDTINDWCHDHEEFGQSYKRACAYRTAHMVNQAKNNLIDTKDRRISHAVWAMLMRFDGSNVDDRRVKIPGMKEAKTLEEKAQRVIDALSDGVITSKEAMMTMKTVTDKMSVEQGTTMLQRLEIVEQRQKLSDHA